MSSLALQIKFSMRHSMPTVQMKTVIKRYSLTFSLVTFLLCSYAWAGANEIIGPEIKVQDNQIRVTTSLSLNEKSLQELRNGVTKELKFAIDLFRVWKMWPDEFVAGKFFVRTLKSDPVTMEYQGTSSDGNTLVQKKFRSFESMIQWAMLINDVKLANVKELEQGIYFVRVTIESKIRKLPPVIGYFMIFLPENEFKIQKDSPFFPSGTRK
jgi:Domain of unknown function (DUF4390)